MQELILQIQGLLARNGAPDWLQRPSAWLFLASAAALCAMAVRLLLKRGAAAQSAPPAPRVERPAPKATGGGVFGAWTEALASQIPESEKERQEFGAVLKQAGLYSKTARASVYAYRFLLLVFPLICAGLVAVSSPLEQTWKIMGLGAIAAAILSIIPRLFVWYRRRMRLAQINGGLADMLDMLSMCLGGGMSISASLEHVAKNLGSYPALSDELHIMRRQSDVGSLRMALADWANRIDTPEVRQVATLLTRGDALGTSLSGSLLDQADHFRTARKQLATLQANRMPVLLTFPLLFCFAPAVLIILMSPAMLQVSEFLNPQNGDNPLMNNGTISTRRITDTLGSLNQDVSAANEQPTFAPAANRQ
jgi:tight adherence protein C